MNAATARLTRQRQADVLSLLAAGESLRQVCARAGMPAAGTVCGWVQRSEKFAQRYRAARRAGGTR